MRHSGCLHSVRALVVIAGIFAPLWCLGGQGRTDAHKVDDVLSQLKSREWLARADGLERLRSDPSTLTRRDVREALLSLLDAENRLVEATLRESKGREGISAKYGEEFGDYLNQLGQTVDSFADWNDSKQVCIFVRTRYDSQGSFAARIASRPRIAVPCLIEMFGSDVGLVRAKAAPVLVQALAKAPNTLNAKTAQKAKQIVRQALLDPYDAVRIDAVRALGRFGGEDMIPALKQVAESDPIREGQDSLIRKWAAEAIVAIQKRAAQKKR